MEKCFCQQVHFVLCHIITHCIELVTVVARLEMKPAKGRKRNYSLQKMDVNNGSVKILIDIFYINSPFLYVLYVGENKKQPNLANQHFNAISW